MLRCVLACAVGMCLMFAVGGVHGRGVGVCVVAMWPAGFAGALVAVWRTMAIHRRMSMCWLGSLSIGVGGCLPFRPPWTSALIRKGGFGDFRSNTGGGKIGLGSRKTP